MVYFIKRKYLLYKKKAQCNWSQPCKVGPLTFTAAHWDEAAAKDKGGKEQRNLWMRMYAINFEPLKYARVIPNINDWW